MKIVVTSQGPELTSQLDPRFGRARYFLLVDTDTDQCQAHDNTENLNAAQGAGIQAAGRVAELGAEAVITGNVGPKALSALKAAGITVYLAPAGTVAEAVERFKAGQLGPADQASVPGRQAAP